MRKLCHQNPSLLNNGPMNLVGNGIIDARCNKYAIIIYYTLIPIPHEGIILSHTIIFHEQDETKQTLFQGQLGWSHNSEVWLPCWLHMINNNWDCKLCQFFTFSQSEIGELVNKLGVARMVTRMFHTPTSGLIDYLFSSSNSVDVKYSQMLTQVIAICIAIWSSIAISSSNSLLTLEEFESRCGKMNLIDAKWNEPSKRKMKWDSQNLKNI